MKLSSTFAAFHAKETKHINCAVGNIFADATVVYRKDTGCHFPSLDTHSAVMCVRSLARNGRRQPSLCLLNFISEMPKNNEIKVAANNSTRNSASSHETANLVSIQNNQAVTTSLKVAEIFGKSHKDVLKAIRALECSTDFIERNFTPYHYISELNGFVTRELPMYYLTRDGFTFLAMGFTGKVAAKFKEDYIAAFNEKEAMIRESNSTLYAEKVLRSEIKKLNKALKAAIVEGRAKYGNNYGEFGELRYGLYYSDELDYKSNVANLCSMVQNAFLDGYFAVKEMRNAKALLSQFREFLSKLY